MRFTPSNIIPSDFEHFDMYDLGGMGEGEFPFNTAPCREFVSVNPVENHDGLGKCDVCGSIHRYGEVWRHVPTDLRICVGHICAHKYGLFASNPDYDRKHAAWIKKVERIKQRRKVRAEMKTFLTSNPELGRNLKADHYIVRDLRSKFIRWGNLSPKQVELAAKIAGEETKRAEVEAAKNYVAVPVTDKRVQVEGKVLGIKFVDGFAYNTEIIKMIVEVETDDGVYKLYGTMPGALVDAILEMRDENAAEYEGLRQIVNRVHPKVRFTCRIERSSDDEFFGFYKRPTKSEVVS